MGFLNIFDGFPFKSFKQMEKERKRYERRIFPFGMQAQRDAAKTVLRELIPNPKVADEERLYAFISVKDLYTREVEEDDEPADQEEMETAARKQLARLRWMTEEDKVAIFTLVRLECRITSLEEYPTAQDVLALLR